MIISVDCSHLNESIRVGDILYISGLERLEKVLLHDRNHRIMDIIICASGKSNLL